MATEWKMVVVFFGTHHFHETFKKDEEWRRDRSRLKEAEKLTKGTGGFRKGSD